MATFSIAETHGPLEAGVFANILLCGIQISQTLTYFERYRRDPLWMRICIGILMFTDFLNTLFACWALFDLTIMNFMNPAAYALAGWVLRTDPAMGGIIACACQMFFAWRVSVLTERKLIGAFIALTGFICMIGGVGIAIALGYQPELAEIGSFRALVLIWLIPAVCGDLAITLSMTYYLRKKRSGFKRTQQIVNRIIRLTVQSCLLTTLCSLGDLLSYLLTNKGYHIGFSFVLPKLYSNAVMSSLNSRRSDVDVHSGWENHSDDPEVELSVMSNHSHHLPHGRSMTMGMTASQQLNNTKVFVDVERRVIGDNKSEPNWEEAHTDSESLGQRKLA